MSDPLDPLLDPEEEAFDLLREIVTLARNGRHYGDRLAKLKALLPQAPGVRQAIRDCALGAITAERKGF